jgi:Bacterial Ig-like domain
MAPLSSQKSSLAFAATHVVTQRAATILPPHRALAAGISVKTDLRTYTTGENARIEGQLYEDENSLPNATVLVQINRTDVSPPRSIDQFSLTPSTTGSFNASLAAPERGQYLVSAMSDLNGKPVEANGKPVEATTTFTAVDIWSTNAAEMLYIGIAFFIALLGVIFLQSRRDQPGQEPFQTRGGAALEVIRFFLITGITFSFLATLLFGETEIGVSSPVGIVRQHIPGAEQNQTQWVINFGGIPKNGLYQGGVQIPILIVILGTLGGYLRYLYGLRYLFATRKEARNKQNFDPDWSDIDVFERSALFKHSIRSLGLIFLSPLLAIGIWFLLKQGGVDSIWTLAAVSLTVGLITEEVIRTLIQFSRNTLAGIKGSSQQQPDLKGPLSVTKKDPDQGSGNVPISSAITAIFSDPVDKASVNTHSFRLTTADINNKVTEITGAMVGLSLDGKTATLTPPTLDTSTDYRATITTEVKDLDGNGLASDEIWSFTTAKYDHKVVLQQSSDHGPSLANGNGRILLAWIGRDTDMGINFMESSDGFSFSGKELSPENSNHSPALAFFNKKFIVAWTGLDNSLNVMKLGEQPRWQKVSLESSTSTKSEPSLAVLDDKIYLCWAESNQLFIRSSSDGSSWSTKTALNETTSSAPSLVASFSKLFVSWNGFSDNMINVKSSKDGISFSSKISLQETSESRPNLALYDETIYLCWQGVGNQLINSLRSKDGSIWNGKVILPETSIHAPTITNIAQHIVIGWTGIDHRLSIDNKNADMSNYFYRV